MSTVGRNVVVQGGSFCPQELIEAMEAVVERARSVIAAVVALIAAIIVSLTPAEGSAILDFFVALQEAHGADFPFGELEIAVDRYWSRYRAFMDN